MEKKYGAFRKQKLPDGSPKHIYLQSVDSHSLMDNNFFERCRRDVVEYVRGGQALDVLIMNTGRGPVINKQLRIICNTCGF